MLPEARKKWTLLGFATLVVLFFGTVGDWFGRTDMGDVYPSDAVSYLDCARAFGRGDFTSALNPLWNQGYPALVAFVRPVFPAGPEGLWSATHWLNLAIFLAGWLVFAWLVRELVLERRKGSEGNYPKEEDPSGAGMFIGFDSLYIFLTAQLCIDQVSRVGPDKLVAVFFFLTCALLVRLLRRPGWALSAGLGFAIGFGYLAKSAFLPLGAVVLLTLAYALWRRHSIRFLLPAAFIFGAIVFSYGAALSRANGYRTLGESGTINYAWHVNRLAKWVHWQGLPPNGAETAAEAWPSPRLARFTQWDTAPPNFGKPLHPTRAVGTLPTIYEFKGPRQATYDPYYDPPYWYRGYRHLFNWRYQVIALGKNLGNLLLGLAVQPLFWAIGLIALFTLRRQPGRHALAGWLRSIGPIAICSLAGILIYTPVHLEERYISAFLAVLALLLLIGIEPLLRSDKLPLALLACGFAAGLAHNQLGGWLDLLHGHTHRDNIKWQMGQAIRSAGLPRGAEVGMISWGANLDADWLNIGEVQVTSEIEDGRDEAAFAALTPERKQAVLAEFRRTGAVALLTRDKVIGDLPGWEKLGAPPVWIYRF